MSEKFHDSMKDIMSLPYFKNENVHSGNVVFGHEDVVMECLIKRDFAKVDKSKFPKLSKSILKKWSDSGDDKQLNIILEKLPKGSFIYQPAGSQGFPDILVKDFSGTYIAIECKSGKNGLTPMWNDNVPKKNAIYVLSSGITNSTTVFLGRDVISQSTYDLMAKQESEIENVVKKYNLLIQETDIFNRGWIQKSRKQHFQQGGSKKTNYFEHPDRIKCEKNVLDFALKQ